MKHKTIFSTMIIITCILIIFFAIVIGFGIWFLNSDNETEADLQWKRKTINDCINQTSQNYDEIRELVCDPGSDVALLGHDYDLLSKLTNLETITIVGISDASDAQNFFEELTKLKKLTSVNIVDSPIGSIRKLADEDSADMDECSAKVKSAVAAVADKLDIVRAELAVKMPATKLCEDGADMLMVLYDREKDVENEPFEASFPLFEGGFITVTFYSGNSNGFDNEQRNIVEIIANTVFIQFNRVVMQELVTHVIKTDIETGAATLDALINYAGMLIAQNRIEDFSIIFFNIHNFKYVNKVLNYEQGDVVLRNYTKTIYRNLSDGEMIARLGGDNFVMLVKNESLREYIDMLNFMNIRYDDGKVSKDFIFSATIGYSSTVGIRYPREVMARASIAYAAARRVGAGHIIEYSENIKQELMKIQGVLSNFMAGLMAGEFEVYYQPKVRIETKEIFGAEALVRWHRKGRLSTPVEFVPLLTNDGSIIKLDYYVLEEVCKWLRKRIDMGFEPLRISVNFSRKHLEEKNMIGNIVALIDKYELDHQLIEIELTESEDYQNFELITEIVNGLRANGIVTSMDDFGTGFSSLNMIKNVDLQVIKIDKSFIPLEKDYEGKDKDLIMFYYIIKMVKKLGKETIAEGVETEQQLDYLREVGCDAVQGFVFDKPLPAAEFEKRLACGYN